jgi:hypothetical protein
MTEDIVKKALESALTSISAEISQPLIAAKQRRDSLALRVSYISEFSSGIRLSLQEIIKKNKAAGIISESYEKDILELDQRISAVIQQTNDEIKRLTGFIEALDFSLGKFSQTSSSFDSEIKKAKEIQELQMAGELEKRRKSGSRPHKLKDIRNYATTPGLAEGSYDADDNQDS